MAEPGDSRQTAAGRAAIETLLVAVLFAAAGAWPAPDVNEATYLAKARHWADPAWGRGDFFLESPDAHGVFFMAFGPLAAALSLESAAWIGRWLGWIAVAAGFRHAVAPLVAGSPGRLAAAAVFSLALRFTTAAGEWVIGGCEAKVFAWALVLAGTGEVVRGRFAAGWGLCGAAAALHPVVGVWAMVATAAARLTVGRRDARLPRRRAAAAWIAAGVALAAAGCVPLLAMTAGVDAATATAAHRIYVVDRLPHHLLPRSFAGALVARHLLAVVVWWLLQRLLPDTPARRRLTAFVAAALAISLAGWLVSLLEPVAPAATYGLLRFYWFRLADVLVPLAVAATVAAGLEDEAVIRAVAPLPPAAVRGVVWATVALDVVAESAHWPLPGRAAVPCRADAKVDAAAWADVCGWVRDHAPADACFLTPRGTASFAWRTGRREVVSWKNSPQDPRSLVEWRRRIDDCFAAGDPRAGLAGSTAVLGAARLREVADRYGADHAIVPRDACGLDALPFPRLFANEGYVVLDLRPVTAAAPPAAPP